MFKPEIGCLTDGILCISDAESASAWTFIGNVKIYLVLYLYMISVAFYILLSVKRINHPLRYLP